MGSLYVVATPIGNLGDISPRALQTLRDVSLIAVEDTRHTGKLLAHFGIATPTISYHSFNARSREQRLLDALAAGDVALVTDAGTPGVSDPGVELVDAALDAGFQVRSLPGPSSLAAAVSVSGLIDGPFTFLGFLPRKLSERASLFAQTSSSGYGVVIFESPRRIGASIVELSTFFHGRRYAVIRELSKIHEEIVRARFDRGEVETRFDGARGEFVIVIDSGIPPAPEIDPEIELRRLINAGEKPNAAAKAVAALTGKPKSELYVLAVQLANEIRLNRSETPASADA